MTWHAYSYILPSRVPCPPATSTQRNRDNETKENEKKGRPGDVDFQRKINRWRREVCQFAKQRHVLLPAATSINVCIRKRPISGVETKKKLWDATSCINPVTVVHECKLKVDGITKVGGGTGGGTEGGRGKIGEGESGVCVCERERE